MLTEWIHGSLDAINDGRYEISKCWYDRIGTPPDRGIIDAVERNRPDVVVYISQADGPFLASVSTFKSIRGLTRSVHLCLDAYDIGFSGLLKRYRDEDAFTIAVATDGGASGPVDLVSFHPVDPRPYPKDTSQPSVFRARPLSLGTAGGFPYGLRKDVMDALKGVGLYIRPREEIYGSYSRYARFLMSCRIVPDCALSAGGPNGQGPYARTLKTRAIEVGLAGACLLELRGCALNRWATEDVDYATYETSEEAVAVAHDLMANPERAKRYAANLARVVREKMSPEVFWGQVFSLIFPTPPPNRASLSNFPAPLSAGTSSPSVEAPRSLADEAA